MNKYLVLTVAAVMAIGAYALAGNSGVADPTISLNKLSPTGGRAQHDKIVADLTALDTAVEAAIDVLDAIQIETGTATNGQVVALSGTYTAAPIVLVPQMAGTNRAYAVATTTNFTMTVTGVTNAQSYVVVPAQ